MLYSASRDLIGRCTSSGLSIGDAITILCPGELLLCSVAQHYSSVGTAIIYRAPITTRGNVYPNDLRPDAIRVLLRSLGV